MYRKSLQVLRYENRMVHGLAARIPTRFLDVSDYELTADEVLACMPEAGKDFYRDEIETLLDRLHDFLPPIAMWQHVSLNTISEEHVLMEKMEFPDSYLAGRLKNVPYGDVFYVKIQDELFLAFRKMTDSFEHYLAGYILSTSLNKVFEMAVLEIAADFPKGSILAMDNPGLSNGWKLAQQKGLIEILFGKPFSRCDQVRIDKHGFFENAYSLTGIIYASNSHELGINKDASPDLSKIRYLSAQELVQMLYRSAGIY